MAGVLERELKYYQEHKEELLQRCEGSFVLIAGEEMIGSYATEGEAYEAGLERLGNQAFLIRRVTKEEETVQFPALAVGVLHGANS